MKTEQEIKDRMEQIASELPKLRERKSMLIRAGMNEESKEVAEDIFIINQRISELRWVLNIKS